MRRFGALNLLVCLGVLSTGCVTSKGKHQSEWAVLDSAKGSECSIWPMREKDLGVKEVALADGRGRAFAVTGMKRDTAPMHYFAPFDGSAQLDPESFIALDLGRGAILLGGTFIDGKSYAFIARNSASKATLEVRTVNDNVVRFKGALADVVVEEGRATSAPGGAWLNLVGEDGSHRIVFVDMGQTMAVHPVPGATRNEPSRILVRATAPKGALLIWKEGETGQPLKAQWVSIDGKSDAAVNLPIPVTSQVESWTAIGHAGGYYLAVIDGDSLIGQSELKISYLNWETSGVQVRWTKSSVLQDEHVTEPVFLVSEKGLEALVLKWIDEESTIARYMVAASTVGKPEFSGIFQKGSRIMEAFTDVEGNDRFVVVRSRGESGWIFRVCEI